MAQTTTNTPVFFSAPGLISAFFRKIWDGLVFIGENSARARMVQEISWMTDEELERAGITRADLVKRVFSDSFHI